jgi:23S rRNA pseudouridine955/2504/2580 synthase
MRAETGSFKASPDQADRRLDRVLRGLFRNVPLGAIMKGIRDGSIRLNGKRTSGDTRLVEGDSVVTPWAFDIPSGGRRAADPAQSKKIVTLFKNDDLWCVEKPAGLLSQPDKAGGDSLITRAWKNLGWNRRDFRPALIGRLDRNVSGVEAIAMNAPALRGMSEATRAGRIGKIYVAMVHGDAPDEGEIDVPLSKDEGRNIVRAAPAGNGRDALTRFRKLSGNGKYSTLELTLVTGRPHQARAHMASIGYPIAGDMKYGELRVHKAGRLMLHAHKISFPKGPELPESLWGLEVISPIPLEFEYVR